MKDTIGTDSNISRRPKYSKKDLKAYWKKQREGKLKQEVEGK